MSATHEPSKDEPAATPFSLPVDFMARYWRQQPLYLPRSAGNFLPESPSRDEIVALLRGGTPHQTDGVTVWFLEGMTSGLPGVAELVDQAREWLEWRDVWCDVFATAGPSSIGSHYDGSDNFTIQLTGNKTWFLSGPEGIHPDDRRRRVLCEPGLGAASMPSTPRAFEVRAGDVLYIPTNWIHWGVSDGDSTSVSLVVNVATAFHALQEQALNELRRDVRWSTPLVVGPGSSAERRSVLEKLVTTDVPERMRPEVIARLGDREGRTTSLKSRFLDRDRELSWDEALVRGYTDRIDSRPEDVRLDSERIAELARARSARNLTRILRQCQERHARTTHDDAKRVYRAVVNGIQGLASDSLDAVLRDPDVCSWLSVAERDSAMAAQRTRAEDPLAHALGIALLPELLSASQHTSTTLTVGVDEDGDLALRRSGIRLLLPDHPERVTLDLRDGELYRLGPGGRSRLIPLRQPGTDADGEGTVALASSSNGITVTTARSEWLSRLAPWRPLGSQVPPQEWRRRVATELDDLDKATAVSGHSAPLVSWALLRDAVAVDSIDDLSVPEMPGLAWGDASSTGGLALAAAAAQAREEVDVIAESFPLVAEGSGGAAERKEWMRRLRGAYLRSRVGELLANVPAFSFACMDDGDGPAAFRSAPLTPWGRALAEGRG
ncbi:cupin domain-containing protein [Streptomyces sp. NBC_00441]|uniref:JmjC domain-containing protein n=1 Tax=Streptomyces sp. NBC_00441 TaxID=2975742 RepID=UPI002E2AE09B|nr:cupin domain-containing protein [Streptomyces sp. NBC_00441]